MITGMIFTGIVAGPYVINLIPESTSAKLPFISEMALAFIAFAAGSELYLRELRSRLNSIKWNTFGQLFVTFIAGIILLVVLRDYIPFLADKTIEATIVIAALTAAIFVARSPASAIAVIKELKAKGPFTQTVMGVTVVKDFLVIVLFSICLSVAQSVLNGDEFNVVSIIFLIGELILSFLLGFYVLGNLLKIPLSLKTKGWIKVFLILMLGYGAYYFSHLLYEQSIQVAGHTLHLEPLLICILGSFYITNYSNYRTEFIKRLHDVQNIIYVAFFTMTGAMFDISVIGNVIGVAGILFAIRISTMIIGSYIGGVLARDPLLHLNLGWMPYITQAGVALGLMTVVSTNFPEWGHEFATTIIALVIINQLIGPPMFKWSIFKIGEDRIRASGHGSEGLKEVIIVGFESLSLALGRQLTENGWKVQIVTFKRKGSIDEPSDLTIKYFHEISKEEFDLINAYKAEAFVMMLSDDENLQLCELVYTEYGTKEIIVRLNHHHNSPRFMEYDAKIVDPSTAIVSLLDHFVRSPQATSLLLGMEENQDTRDIELLNPDLHGIALRDLRLPSDVIVLSITRTGQSIISHGYTRLRIRDIVTIVGSIKSLEEVQFKFGK